MKKSLVFAAALLFSAPVMASPQELIKSVLDNDLQGVIRQLENGEDVNGANEQGNTALHYAVAKDNGLITKALLAYGANVDAANNKGWTPLMISEKKDVKNVSPLLAEAKKESLLLQQSLQKTAEQNIEATKNTAETQVKTAIDTADENTKKAIVEINDMMNKTIVHNTPIVAEEKTVLKPETPEVIKTVEIKLPAEEKIAESAKQTAEKVIPAEVKAEMPKPEVVVIDAGKKQDEAKAPATVEAGKIEVDADTYKDLASKATKAALEAKKAQARAETENQILLDELLRLKNRNAILEKQLQQNNTAAKSEAKVPATEKTVAKTAAVVAPKQAAPKVAAGAVKKRLPPVTKKPVLRQPVLEKIVLTPSTLDNQIFAGDEEIVYCLTYLGHGENRDMLSAAKFYAASASISEARYQKIAAQADNFVNTATETAFSVRNRECSNIITPSDTNKVNQIIRSINQARGY